MKIVLFPLLQVMSKIAVARRISTFLTTALLWVAEEQFLCIALQLLYLGPNKLLNYFQFFQYLFCAMDNQHKYCGSEETMGETRELKT